MKSTCKKFLAMFLAVLFVMGTMVTSASATTDDDISVAQTEVAPRNTTNYVVQTGGSLPGRSLKRIPFTVEKSATYHIIVSASGGDILASLEGSTPHAFNIAPVYNHTNLNRNCFLTAGLTYTIVVTNTAATSVGYGVLVY